MVAAAISIPNHEKRSIGTKATRASADEIIRPEIGKVIRTI